ncbi:MAG: nucleotidyltransferase domain-containing protein [bacterium]
MAKKTIPKKVKKEIERFVETLKKDKLPIKELILFGSYAKGNPRKWSDIDLCVVSPKFKDSWDATTYLWKKRIIFDIDYTIEPVGFSPKDFRESNSLINEIKKTGIRII